MRRAGLLALGLVLMASLAQAQVQGCNQQKKWNWDGSELYWEWGAIVDPPPTGFRVKLGTKVDVYTVTKDFPASQFSATFPSLTPGPGAFYAVIAPMYGAKEGEASEPCFFDSGRARLSLGVRKTP